MSQNKTQHMDFVNEFASIRISREVGQCGVRLKFTDLETDASTYMDPLELASLCESGESDRLLVVSGPMYQHGTEVEER
ncbi:hypothetical protein [Rhodococcoides fascians]|uniref:hypothetical protein n=1 Tax=Rhodococcoides fascians TaxID=1828 RepID=UPI0012FD9122|nr:hypothetical protein [Rhodococcus fascians]